MLGKLLHFWFGGSDLKVTEILKYPLHAVMLFLFIDVLCIFWTNPMYNMCVLTSNTLSVKVVLY